MDYSKLEPGLYLQRGNAIKSIDQQLVNLIGGTPDSDLNHLAATVSWLWIALTYRSDKALEVPYHWERNTQEIDEPPFVFDWLETVPRIDTSLQLNGVAYLLKQRKNGRFVGLRWLDPSTIEPDSASIDPMRGYTRYWRNMQNGARMSIPADDMLRIILPSQSELDPPPSAAMATSLQAQILYGLGITADGYFDNGGLPINLVNVPAATSDTDKNRLQEFFARIFNRRRTGISRKEARTIAVREGITVSQISLAPKDLAMTELERSQIEAILGAHKVPLSLVMANAANYATASQMEQSFVGTIAARLEYVARQINKDKDVKATAVTLIIDGEQHPAMQQDEAQRSVAGLRYVEMGMTPEAAAYLIGINEDDFPDGMQIWATVEPVIIEQAPSTPPAELIPDENEDDMTLEMKAQIAEEERRFMRWYKKRANADIDDFNSAILDRAAKLALLDDSGETYQDPMAKAFFATLDEIIKATRQPERPLTVAPVIHVHEKDVTVNPPEVTYKAEAANVYVNVPEQAPPQVTVNVPEQAAPVVNVEAPNVNIDNTVEFPNRARELATVQRDRDGKIETVRTVTEFE